MRMKREPLTSTDAHAGASPSAAISSSTRRRSARAPANSAHRARALRAGRPELLDAALARVGADLAWNAGPARRPRPCRRAAASAAPAAPPARRSRPAPNRGWRCSCRRPASARRRRSTLRSSCERPLTGRNASRPRPTASSGAAGGERRRRRRPARCARCAGRRRAARTSAAPAGVCSASVQWSPAQAARGGDVGAAPLRRT